MNLLQLSLSCRDSLALGRPDRAREQALALAGAAADLAAALEPPPPEPEAPPPAPQAPPPSRWRRVADELGEPVLVLRSRHGLHGVEPCLEYAVALSRATGWELTNALETVEPTCPATPGP